MSDYLSNAAALCVALVIGVAAGYWFGKAINRLSEGGE